MAVSRIPRTGKSRSCLRALLLNKYTIFTFFSPPYILFRSWRSCGDISVFAYPAVLSSFVESWCEVSIHAFKVWNFIHQRGGNLVNGNISLQISRGSYSDHKCKFHVNL